MRARSLIPLSLVTAALLASCAMDGSQPSTYASEQGSQCFRNTEVTGFSDAGPNVAIVNVGNVRSWELQLSPGCPHMDYAMKVGIVSRGGTRICEGKDAELLVPNASGSGFQRCLVREVRRMTPEEAAASRGQSPRP